MGDWVFDTITLRVMERELAIFVSYLYCDDYMDMKYDTLFLKSRNAFRFHASMKDMESLKYLDGDCHMQSELPARHSVICFLHLLL
jgi:hypothetical protein